MKKTVKDIRNGGRPKSNDAERKGKSIGFRVDTLTFMAFDQKVKDAKLSMSEFIRRAIKNAEISPSEGEGYFSMIDDFTNSNLLDLISASATVVQPLSNEELKSLKDLYRFALDVNALVKRGNASLGKETDDVRVNYIAELSHLQDEFNEIKDYFMKRVIGEYKERAL